MKNDESNKDLSDAQRIEKNYEHDKDIEDILNLLKGFNCLQEINNQFGSIDNTKQVVRSEDVEKDKSNAGSKTKKSGIIP